LGHFTDELWQKAHFGPLSSSQVVPGRIAYFFNLLFFRHLGARCNFQQFSCDTVTFVQRHLSEVV
jgi:hypothetical protein